MFLLSLQLRGLSLASTAKLTRAGKAIVSTRTGAMPMTKSGFGGPHCFTPSLLDPCASDAKTQYMTNMVGP